jgi:hypothetical protein
MVLLETLQRAVGNIGGNGWTSFVPDWGANVTVGNAINEGLYAKIGKTVIGRARLVFGTTTSIAGIVSLVYPVTAKSSTFGNPSGIVRMYNSGVETNMGNINPAGLISVYDSSGTYVKTLAINATVPFTWGTGDELVVTFFYECE